MDAGITTCCYYGAIRRTGTRTVAINSGNGGLSRPTYCWYLFTSNSHGEMTDEIPAGHAMERLATLLLPYDRRR